MGKRLLTALVGLCLISASASAERVELSGHSPDVDVIVEGSTIDRTVVRFEIGAFEQQPVTINGQTYFEISAGGEGNNLEAGQPNLPHVSRSIIIPDDAAMAINVLSSDFVDYPMTPVAPSKGNLLRTVNPEDVPYEFGREYLMTGFFPDNLAGLREPYIMRDYRGIVLDISPFQYDPEHQTLRVYKSITVEVVTTGPGQINVKHSAKRESVVSDFDYVYGNHFLNYGQAAEKYTLVEETGSMLIICYDAWMPNMQPLVDWKLQKGINTVMVPKTTAGSTASAIDAYIQSYYDSTDVAFVLLVGDAAQIPTLTSGGGGADPMFALVDGGDSYPDIFVGRFSCENTTHVNTMVQRTITYERDAAAGDWYHKGTGVASNQGPGHNGGEYDNVHMDKIRDTLMMIGTYTEVDQIYDPSGTAAQVAAAFNNGRSIANYCGHGSTTAWSTTGFSNSNVDALVNDNMPPFIFSVACVNGNFVSYTCFGEAWLRASHNGVPTGAIGAYMSSINQSWDPPMDAEDEFNRLIVREVVSSYGAICFNGSCKMIDINGSGGISMYNTWHIFGDPSVQVRTDSPAPLTVNHAGAAFFNLPEYEVEVVGVENALCALYADGVLYGYAYTDAGGNALIPVSGLLPIGTPATLTVTAYNAETVVDEVIVTTDLTVLTDPLGDTKDTLNDYQVDCLVYSDTALFMDSVIIRYDNGSGYASVAMSWTGGDELSDDFTGYIPAQAAGTTVDYYIWAKNLGGFVDSTEVFSFFVLDYGLFMAPEFSTTSAPVDDTVWYDLAVTNDGVLADVYNLTVNNATWPTAVYDAAGTSVITATTSLVGDATFNFKLQVIVPSSWEDEFDSVQVVATSTGDGSYSDFVTVKTVSTGQPWPIPFSDNFPTTTLDMTKWEAVGGVLINGDGLAEPSEPYSANIDAYDVLETEQVALRDLNSVVLRYWYQRTGGSDSPEPGDNLNVEYIDSVGTWHLLSQQLGDGPDMTEYEEVVAALPADAYHNGFRVRFRSLATSSNYDDWFVDDIFVGYPSDYELMLTPYSQSQYGPAGDTATYTMSVVNRGLLDDQYSLAVAGNAWTTLFYDASGTTPMATIDVVAGDTAQFTVKVVIPGAAAPHSSDLATVTATSLGDPVMTSTAMAETFSGGPAIAFPMYEPFAETDLSLDRWFTNVGGEISSESVDPPTTPYALCLDGGDDTVTTRLINIAGQDGAIMTYYCQAGGNGDAPEIGDNLTFMYKNAYGDWITFHTEEADGTSWSQFQYVNVALPLDAVHAGFQLRIISSGGTVGQDEWFLDDLRIDFAPEIAVNPTSISEMLAPGASTSCDVVISNVGPGGLTYALKIQQLISRNEVITSAGGEVEPANHDYPDEFYTTDEEKGADSPYHGVPNTRGMGGPDAFGYVWIDSDEGVGGLYDFGWIDVSGTGTDVIGDFGSNPDDVYAGPYPIGFDFVFYGNVYNQIYIGSNGIIGFAAAGMNSRINVPIPAESDPDNIIALLWDDLNPGDSDCPGAHLYLHSDGSRLVIQFVDYAEYNAAAGDVMNAEAILYADGTIKLQYLSLAPGFTTNEATVGIENLDGTDGCEVNYNAAYLHDNLAITFARPDEWLSIDKYSGNVAPGQSDTVHCEIVAGELEEGTYNANLVVSSNDPTPMMNPFFLPAQLIVTSGPIWICGDADGNGVGPDVADLVYMVAFMFSGGTPPPIPQSIDIDGSGGDADVADLVYLVQYMFSGGPAPDCGL
ncbi:MAG: C25 family cysteine peptidase [bacterium]